MSSAEKAPSATVPASVPVSAPKLVPVSAPEFVPAFVPESVLPVSPSVLAPVSIRASVPNRFENRLMNGSAPVHARLQRHAAGQASHRLFQPLIKLGVAVVAGLIQIGDPAFLDETPCPAAFLLVFRIPYAKRHAAGAAYQRKTGNVRVAVADKNHLLEWDAQLVLGHLAVDLERFAARRLPAYAFLDMEQVARLVGEAHDTTRTFDGAIVAVVEFGRPDIGDRKSVV